MLLDGSRIVMTGQRRVAGAVALLLAATTLAVGLGARQVAAASAPPMTATPIVTGLDIPWDVSFLPDGTMLFDQRKGVLSVRLPGGQVRVLTADFSDIWAAGESGLMGLAVDPGFAGNHTIYTCQGYSKGGVTDVRVLSWQLDTGYTTATRTSVVLSGIRNSGRHSGCRLRFDNSGLLFVATGDSALGTAPQDLASPNGKVLRMTTTGQPAPGNPFIGSANPVTRLIYTYGHRNVQGLSLRPGTNDMWSVEQGTDRDDEVNRLVGGANYGYDPIPGYNESVPMTDLAKYPDARSAVYSTGNPTLALSGGTWLSGSQWGSLDGTFVAAALKATSVRVLAISAQNALQSVSDIPELSAFGRLRTAQQGPDGALYVTTSNGGGQDSILRVTLRSTPGDPQCGTSGSNLASPVGATATASGVTAFVVGTDRSVFARKVGGPTFVPLGGRVLYGPAAASWGGERIDLFVVGTDAQLFHGFFTANGAWGGWEALGGYLTSSPAAVSFTDGTVNVYARGQDNALWTKRWTGNAWSGWSSLGGLLSAAPGAAVDKDTGAGQVGVRGLDGRMFTLAVSAAGAAGPFTEAGFVSCSAVSYSARTGDGKAFPFAGVGRSGRVELQDGSLITPDGAVLGSVALVTPGTAGFAFVGRGLDGSLWLYDARSGLGTWSNLGGQII